MKKTYVHEYILRLLMVVLLLSIGVFVMSLFLSQNKGFFYRDKPEGLCEALLPDKPNWVSSLVSISDPHYIASLPVDKLATVSAAIYQIDPKSYVLMHEHYLEGFHRTKFWGFTDWFCIKSDGNVTASATLGHSDLGYNRRWVENLRKLLER